VTSSRLLLIGSLPCSLVVRQSRPADDKCQKLQSELDELVGKRQSR